MKFDLQLPEDLKEPPGPFVPSAQYSHCGDLLKVYLEDEPAYAKQLTPEITVLLSFKDHRIVGVKIANIAEKVTEKRL